MIKKIIEFLFFRWKCEIHARGQDTFIHMGIIGTVLPNSEFKRDYIDYKYTNKFDGSTKIKRVYLN